MSSSPVSQKFTDPSSVWANLRCGNSAEKYIYRLQDDSGSLILKVISVALIIIGVLAVDYKMGHVCGLLLGGALLATSVKAVFTLNAKMRRAYGEKCMSHVLEAGIGKVTVRHLQAPIPHTNENALEAFTSFDPSNPVVIEQLISPEGESSIHLHIVNKNTKEILQLLVAYYHEGGKYPQWFGHFWAIKGTLQRGESVLQTTKDIIEGKHDTYELLSL